MGLDSPHLHIKPSLYVCRRAQGPQNLQTEFNYLDSFMFYRPFKILASLAPGGREGGWGVSGMISVISVPFTMSLSSHNQYMVSDV